MGPAPSGLRTWNYSGDGKVKSETRIETEDCIFYIIYLFEVTGHSSVSSFIVRDEKETQKRSRSRVFRYSDNSWATESNEIKND